MSADTMSRITTPKVRDLFRHSLMSTRSPTPAFAVSPLTRAGKETSPDPKPSAKTTDVAHEGISPRNEAARGPTIPSLETAASASLSLKRCPAALKREERTKTMAAIRRALEAAWGTISRRVPLVPTHVCGRERREPSPVPAHPVPDPPGGTEDGPSPRDERDSPVVVPAGLPRPAGELPGESRDEPGLWVLPDCRAP